MPWRVGDDEFPLLGREVAVRDINRDALLAFGSQAIDQQRKVEFTAAGTDAARVGRERRELVGKDHLRFEQQPPDQCRFAVVHRPTGNEAQQALVLLCLEVGLELAGISI